MADSPDVARSRRSGDSRCRLGEDRFDSPVTGTKPRECRWMISFVICAEERRRRYGFGFADLGEIGVVVLRVRRLRQLPVLIELERVRTPEAVVGPDDF